MIGECLATAWDDWTESLGVAGFLTFLFAFADGRRISGGFMLLVLSSFSALLQNR